MATQEATREKTRYTGGLILTRRANETIEIDGGIRVVIERVKGNQVKVRVQAPHGTRILRGEIEPHEQDERTSGI